MTWFYSLEVRYEVFDLTKSEKLVDKFKSGSGQKLVVVGIRKNLVSLISKISKKLQSYDLNPQHLGL